MGYAGSNVTDCENSAAITAPNSDCVGGIVGYASVGTSTFSNLKNTGAVTGKTYTGGIAGYIVVSYSSTMSVATCSNSGNITGGDYTAGIVGYANANDYNNSINFTDLSNTGDVKGGNYVGGLVAYATSRNAGTLVGGSNSGAITATGVNGELIASSYNITIS